MAQEQMLIKAQKEFDSMCDWIRNADQEGLRIDQVEREIFSQLLALGLLLLKAFLAAFGRGNSGKQVRHRGRTLRRSENPHTRRYLSIFGELLVKRFVYAKRPKQKIEHVPLDAKLGMPSGEFSYVLEDWLQRLCFQGSFEEGVESLFAWLGVKPSVRSAESMNRRMATHAEAFRPSQAPPPAAEEGEIQVATADGKGVPMQRPLEERLGVGKRRGKGQKKNKKKMAYVGAVYTIDRFPRTAEDIVGEVMRQEEKPVRPRPQHKRVWAEMTRPPDEPEEEPIDKQHDPNQGKTRLFMQLGAEVQKRDPQRKKLLVCLMDGERGLWEIQRQWLPKRAIGILDIYHVMERLWSAAYCFQPEGSKEAEALVTHWLRMLLEGKVGYLIGSLRRRAAGLSRGKLTKLNQVIGYFNNNRRHMKYNEYLAAGFPIGSGVAEGACRHVVKDRMERTGMRWTVEGAQAMLHLRAIYINGDWDNFLNHRIQAEQSALYSQAA